VIKQITRIIKTSLLQTFELPLHPHLQFQCLLRGGRESCHHVCGSRCICRILHSATYNNNSTNATHTVNRNECFWHLVWAHLFHSSCGTYSLFSHNV